MPDRVALVAFKFPPYEQVGARRWTKLCRRLADTGVEIDVLTTRWGPDSDSAVAEVSHPNIRIHRVPCLGLHRIWYARFGRGPFGRLGTFVQKVVMRLAAGRPWAIEARYWGKRVVPEVVRVLDERDIGVLVATGGPSWAVHWAAQAARQRPDVRFIIDYRDPWIELPHIESWPDKRRLAEVAREAKALEAANAAVAVTEGLAEIVRAKRVGLPVRVVPNGFDAGEFPDSTGASERPRPFVLLHAGNPYAGREQTLVALLESVHRVAGEMPELEVHFYGGFPAFAERDFADLVAAGVVRSMGRVGPDELMRRIEKAFGCIQLNAHIFPFLVSTKIYEYGFARRPVLSVNYGGEIERLVEDCRLGWNSRGDIPDSIDEALREMHETWRRNPAYATEPVGLEEYDYDRIAERYREVLLG